MSPIFDTPALLACEQYHDKVLAWLDRNGAHPGNDTPPGYLTEYAARVKKAPLPSDFKATEAQWKEYVANRGRPGNNSAQMPISAAMGVNMTKDTFGDLPTIIRTLGEVIISAKKGDMDPVPSAPRPVYPAAPRGFPVYGVPRVPRGIRHARGRFPAYGISAGARPIMGKPNRASSGLVGRVGGGIEANAFKRGAKKDRRDDNKKKHGRRGKRGGRGRNAAAGASVATISANVAAMNIDDSSTLVGPAESQRDFTPLPESVVPESVAPQDVFLEFTNDAEMADEPTAPAWDDNDSDSGMRTGV
ncbi:hypothetical protein DFH07DRAFT_775702 [Mycena maculata]|uniref:Uncharacterized protein n=1 Tax=Mycena maculata TaxID=230809 RepID=A0AAD7N6Z2_9AGAR|nr:hypothetical protein DFH07DRAFT_775702 [Mycena maculata]